MNIHTPIQFVAKNMRPRPRADRGDDQARLARAGHWLRRRHADRAPVSREGLRRPRHRDRHGPGDAGGRARAAGDARRRRHRPRPLPRPRLRLRGAVGAPSRRWRNPAWCWSKCSASAPGAVVSFPNFGHWRLRWQLLWTGRMPMTPTWSRHWYETPNIHPCTIRDFFALCAQENYVVEQWLAADDEGRRAPWRRFPPAGQPVRGAGAVRAETRLTPFCFDIGAPPRLRGARLPPPVTPPSERNGHTTNRRQSRGRTVGRPIGRDVRAMRIFFVSLRLPFPPDRGDRITTFNEIRHFSRSHEVHAFCLAHDQQDSDGIPGLLKYAASVNRDPRLPPRRQAARRQGAADRAAPVRPPSRTRRACTPPSARRPPRSSPT